MFGLVALAAAAAAAAQPAIETSLDRDSVFLGETVTLRIDLENPTEDARPDYAGLENNFIMLDTGSNRSLELINGQRSLKVQHYAVLEPREAGQVTVPSIAVGTLRSSPQVLAVLERPQDARAPEEEVFIRVDASPLESYVQSQIRLTVTLYHALAITEGALNPGTWPEGVVVERLGNDKPKVAFIDGQRYRTVERRFALFPERSGSLTIPAFTFRGRVADSSQRSAVLFSRGRRVTVSSDPITVRVDPKPAAFTGDVWLPAAELSLAEDWPNGEPTFVQGEPVTRSLTIEGRGLQAVQLPEIALPELEGMKVYPDQPASLTRFNAVGWVEGTRTQSYALVPTKAGPLTLPEIRIPWWDIQAHQERELLIPARTIEVQPGAASLVTPANLPVTTADLPQAGVSGPADPGVEQAWRLTALALAALWLVTLAAWWRARSGPRHAAPETGSSDEAARASEKQWRDQLRKACEVNDGKAATQAVLGLFRVLSPDVAPSLSAIAARVDDDGARQALLALDRCRYGEEDTAWSGVELASFVRTLKPAAESAARPAASSPLPPLYTAIVLCTLPLVALAQPAAECSEDPVLLHGGAIYTALTDAPKVAAMVYSPCGQILATGREAGLAERFPKAERSDLNGATVVPGLIDAHGHLMGLGESLLRADLRGAESLEEALSRLEAFEKTLPDGAWLLGRGWDQNDWAGQEFPSKEDLDEKFPERPVWLRRIDGHAGWANSAALAEADRDFAGSWQVEGGLIQRNATGEASGILVDRAMGLVESQVPLPSAADRDRALKLALAALAKVGITAVHDAGTSWEDLKRFARAEKDGQLTLRVYAMADGPQELLGRLCENGPVKTPYVSARSVKLYADGALGSRGAALIEDYSDEPGNRGLLLQPAAQLATQIEKAMGCGLQVNIHAIGDLGNRVVLDGVEAAMKAHPDNAGRHRVEHAQVIADADFPRFRSLGLIASVQPTHA
ncbi:MAG: amidohydrolase family protein, partial [Pseudomonadota bacterium]